MKFKLAIFDFDGTVMDTSPGIFATANAAISALGLKAEEDRSILARFVGPPIRDSFVAVYNLEESLIDKAVEIYRVLYDEKGRYGAQLYEGMAQTLEALKEGGYHIAIATLKPEVLVKQMTDHFGLTPYFDSIRGSDPIHKTSKALVMRHVLEDLNTSPRDAVLIGDTPHDEEGAKEVGSAFIAVDWGFGFPKGHGGSPSTLAVAERPLQLLEFLL
jgi:phosphoglycolate phosphatase